ncbi:hypothetical protein KAR91_23575, partial [Candidatus Pacearchaeota archaeon]|nr:hypothetical protein [Candidatus Pacearchaeota archaeon]
VEGRLSKGKFISIKEGDILILAPDNQEFEVLTKSDYNSFREMIMSEGLEDVSPDKNNIEEVLQVYYRFYSKEQERQFGVIAMKIKRIN